MFSRINLQAKAYYGAQADLAYIDSLFENIANSETPVAYDNDAWMARAEKARIKMAATTEAINKLGGAVKGGNVYDGKGQVIRSHMALVA